jgi:hypothetical protein
MRLAPLHGLHRSVRIPTHHMESRTDRADTYAFVTSRRYASVPNKVSFFHLTYRREVGPLQLTVGHHLRIHRCAIDDVNFYAGPVVVIKVLTLRPPPICHDFTSNVRDSFRVRHNLRPMQRVTQPLVSCPISDRRSHHQSGFRLYPLVLRSNQWGLRTITSRYEEDRDEDYPSEHS